MQVVEEAFHGAEPNTALSRRRASWNRRRSCREEGQG